MERTLKYLLLSGEGLELYRALTKHPKGVLTMHRLRFHSHTPGSVTTFLMPNARVYVVSNSRSRASGARYKIVVDGDLLFNIETPEDFVELLVQQ